METQGGRPACASGWATGRADVLVWDVLGSAIHGLVAGLIGGAAYVTVSDLLQKQSLNVAAQNALRRAPAIGIATGVILTVYTTFECTVEFARNKEDAANSFIAGGITGALLSSRGGPQVMAVNALFWGTIFGVLDGLL